MQANSAGAVLLIHRRAVQVSWRDHRTQTSTTIPTLQSETRTFASSVQYTVPLDLIAGCVASQIDTMPLGSLRTAFWKYRTLFIMIKIILIGLYNIPVYTSLLKSYSYGFSDNQKLNSSRLFMVNLLYTYTFVLQHYISLQTYC